MIISLYLFGQDRDYNHKPVSDQNSAVSEQVLIAEVYEELAGLRLDQAERTLLAIPYEDRRSVHLPGRLPSADPEERRDVG